MIELNTPNKRVRVRIPASTSNLGPGFDVFGLALKLYNEVDLEILSPAGPDIVEISGEGETTLPRDKTNMVLFAVRSCLPRGGFANALRLRLTNRIPIARGLGSSAAARLGGIVAVHALLESKRMNDKTDKLLEAACRMEGHPDNIVPALHGGFCISAHGEDRIHFAPIVVPRDLGVVVCVPNFELSTEKARRILPDQVSREDAVTTAARVAFLIRAIEHKEFRWLRYAMQDVLHQPYRRKLVPGMTRVIEAAVNAGAYGASLSGAGPSIIAFAPRGSRGGFIGRAMQKAFAQVRIDSRYFVLDIDRKGASVEIVE